MEDRNRPPRCCGAGMARVLSPPMVARPFADYVTPCYDNETGRRMRIRTRDEHRAFLARNGLEEIGNDRRYAPKSQEELQASAKRHEADAKAAPMVDVEALKKEGWIQEDLIN